MGVYKTFYWIEKKTTVLGLYVCLHNTNEFIILSLIQILRHRILYINWRHMRKYAIWCKAVTTTREHQQQKVLTANKITSIRQIVNFPLKNTRIDSPQDTSLGTQCVREIVSEFTWRRKFRLVSSFKFFFTMVIWMVLQTERDYHRLLTTEMLIVRCYSCGEARSKCNPHKLTGCFMLQTRTRPRQPQVWMKHYGVKKKRKGYSLKSKMITSRM